jgi:hypothetical protein
MIWGWVVFFLGLSHVFNWVHSIDRTSDEYIYVAFSLVFLATADQNDYV